MLCDEELIGSYLVSNRTACLSTLYKRYAQKVYGSCLAFTRDPIKAEDYMHDIFLQVFVKIDQFQGRSAFSTWLFAISQNYCRQRARAASRMELVAMDEVDVENVQDTDVTDIKHLMLSQLAVVLEGLEPDKKALLQLKYIENIDIADIARQYNINNSAVKMRLKRTRDQIAEAYQRQFVAD
ncbi:RNA polymerase sigma-70 factor (ECF subfamily) [Larkinella arboricola]|uniref:RNA polymerase sigma-70 factor (ECF subfamily) n=2 Tax=Larkinella arboricola TaxID=643671 RepID=A0A327WWH8_LARAB|nr:RNA polymerase sigma-70 factor (ECF subfamily) [Larkinella arboricola]